MTSPFMKVCIFASLCSACVCFRVSSQYVCANVHVCMLSRPTSPYVALSPGNPTRPCLSKRSKGMLLPVILYSFVILGRIIK